jgi:aminoglycoside phosphotransferase (APT) family kinase protein
VLPEQVRRWAGDLLAARLVDAVPVPGGITDTIWRLTLDGDSPLILRWVEPERFGEEGRQWVLKEALGCRLTADVEVPSPRLVASDPDGRGTGGWANLTTFRPGRVRLEELSGVALVALARVAVAVHAAPVAEQERPPPFAFWGEPDPAVPVWATRPELWRRAIALAAENPPDTTAGLIHRDFHPGNTLWLGDEVSGLIDWAETSWGPPDLDVAHACSNFAMLHSVADAVAFRRAYLDAGGRLDPDVGGWRYWQVRDILGFLPDPGPVVVALTRQRPTLTPEGVRGRLEDLLALTLDPRRPAA